MKTFFRQGSFIPVLLAVITIDLLSSSLWASELQSKIMDDWEEQYRQIQEQIQDRGTGLAKSAFINRIPESQAYNRNALVWDSDNSPMDVFLRRIGAMIQRIKELPGAPDLRNIESQYLEIRSRWHIMRLAKTSAASSETDDLYLALRKVGRQAALSNPLLDFDDLLFLGYADAGNSHMCQYHGWIYRKGGGLYILRDFKTDNPTLVNVLENSTVENGRLAGQRITGQAFLAPDLHWNGDTVVFAMNDNECWHIMRVDIDGGNLRMITDGESPYDASSTFNSRKNDFDPIWLPNGRIVFMSERRGGLGRCHSNAKPTHTLFSMNSDGSDLICIDFHETNEWHPSVNNDGMIVYTRWDYIDREDCIAHHIWTCYPDGRDPRAPHGNYPIPISTMEGSGWPDGRVRRPFAEFNIRAIPGSHKYVATAGPHHEQAFGSLIILDTRIEDDNEMSQIMRLTPEEPFPESEAPQLDADGARSTYQRYGTAWALSEDFFLVSHDGNLVLLSSDGTRDIIYRVDDVPGSDRLIDPIPIKPQERPPIIPTQTYQGERFHENAPNATIYVNNVYVADEFGQLPEGTVIKEMRIVQVFPKLTNNKNEPRIAHTSESLARMALGVVPVEEDGSVYCEAPVNKEIYFQLLDENGMAMQSMRSGTYVHPGEQMSCVGCHENKWESVPITPNAMAMQRPPSTLEPEAGGVEPVNFYRLVKPVFDEKCTPCHNNQGGPDMSYGSLGSYDFGFPGDQRANYLVTDFGGSRTTPGRFGAMESRLYRGGYLDASHYDVNLTQEEFRRITLWLDLGSNELASELNIDAQRRGELIWPPIDVDPDDPQGVERRVVPNVPQAVKAEKGLKAIVAAGRILLDLPFEGDYTITVHTLSGKEEGVYRARQAKQFSFSTESFAQGIYVVRASAGHKRLSAKIFISEP
jgi:hypothetical protein